MEKLVNDFSFGLFFWQALIFIVLVLLLVKFAWRPIMTAIVAREAGIAAALAAAEAARKEMQNLQADNQRILQEARAERDAMLKEAREIKDKIVSDARAEAQAQGEKMIEQAKATIDSEKKAAMAELKNQVTTLSVEIAEKILKTQLSDAAAQASLVDKMLDDVKLN
ncbi:F0F1 ATP synthase subunit B [Flavobacterium sp.]|uniref:F0F1 ATP synthase subunit B n=1 Tax=Flavobacterium sp. TaxID=239 RepID=UPI00260D45C9|nr:F0F1 ATP synthase subunit B [Flavobacterium sp.]